MRGVLQPGRTYYTRTVQTGTTAVMSRCKCLRHDGAERWHGTCSGRQYHGCLCDRCVTGTAAYHAQYQRARSRYRKARRFRCEECGAEFTAVRARRYCSDGCRSRASSRVKKADSDRRRAIADERKRRLWVAQGRRCALCTEPLSWEAAQLDRDRDCCGGKRTSFTCGKCDRGVVHARCGRLLALARSAEPPAAGARERVMRGLEALVPA